MPEISFHSWYFDQISYQVQWDWCYFPTCWSPLNYPNVGKKIMHWIFGIWKLIPIMIGKMIVFLAVLFLWFLCLKQWRHGSILIYAEKGTKNTSISHSALNKPPWESQWNVGFFLDSPWNWREIPNMMVFKMYLRHQVWRHSGYPCWFSVNCFLQIQNSKKGNMLWRFDNNISSRWDCLNRRIGGDGIQSDHENNTWLFYEVRKHLHVTLYTQLALYTL